MNIALSALCGAHFLFFVFWLIFAVVCFAHASAEVKKSEPEEEQDSPQDITMILYAVDGLRWRSKRGYMWGGGYHYD